MRAVLCTTLGKPSDLTLGEIDRPTPGQGQVLIKVHAAGCNFADTLIISGGYQEKPALPFVPGMEVAGVVEACGPGTTRLEPGDRVMGAIGTGAFAEYAVAAERALTAFSADIDCVTAASMPIAYGTSHIALDHRAALKAGESLLVLGAAGGVGLAAVEIGKAMGATVIGAAGGPEKCAIAREHGADHVIDYKSENLRARLNEIVGKRGVDVVYDPVGGDLFDAALRSLGWEGRMLVIGFAAGRVPAAPANILLVKNISVIGVYWGAYQQRDPALAERSRAQLLAWLAAGKLRPLASHRLPLAEAPRALELLTGRQSTGKVVIEIG